MSGVSAQSSRTEDSAVVAAAQAGDESAFSGLVERYRPELQAHCYRMLGSFDESEDLVQETFLRAWRKRESFQGRSTFRAWLYRIATNACLDTLSRRPRRVLPHMVAAASGPDATMLPPSDLPWLQPYPDRLLDPVAASHEEPDAAVVAKETIELVFLVAIQHLSPRQRAVLILRDVLGWPAKETADLLDSSSASVNSALQRARTTVKEYLPSQRLEWTRSGDPSGDERVLLERYMRAHERADIAAMAELLAEDVRFAMPPWPTWWQGRDTVAAVRARDIEPTSPHYVGDVRLVPTRANRQPAAAIYLRRQGSDDYQAVGMDVLRIEGGRVAEIVGFVPQLFPAFDLPLTLAG